MKFERELRIIENLIDDFSLDLTGLNVLSECASGPYAFTAMIIHLAGGNSFNLGRDSVHGNFIDNKSRMLSILGRANVKNAEFFENQFPDNVWAIADIIPNLGFIRPITDDNIQLMKETSVIPLMWETWEFRKADLDIMACINKGIPVIGTNENGAIKMFKYNGFFTLKLLFDLGLEVWENKFLVMGSGKTASSVIDLFDELGLHYSWYSTRGKLEDPRSKPYKEFENAMNEDYYDGLILLEHIDPNQLIGTKCKVDFLELKRKFSHIKVAHICGSIDKDNLYKSGIPFLPKDIKDFGYMSYQVFDLGPKPVLELNTLGLKVGEIAARKRLAGASIEETIKETINQGYGQDFVGGFLNFKI